MILQDVGRLSKIRYLGDRFHRWFKTCVDKGLVANTECLVFNVERSRDIMPELKRGE